MLSDSPETQPATETDAPAVTAVVLNWNNYEDTARCVESLQEQAYQNFRVVVVDNGSTDGSGERIEAEFPAVELVYTGENLGFGGGMNAGIEKALREGADYVWLVNNDTLYPDPDVLETIVRTAEERENVGIVTPLIRSYPETDETFFERGFIDPRSYNADVHRGTRSVLDLRFDKEPVEAHAEGPLVRNDFIPLCSALVSREVFEELGTLPEEYFLYYEDADYGSRATAAGYELLTHRDCEVYHKVEGSSESRRLPEFYKVRNRFLFARRRGGLDLGFLLVLLWRLVASVGYNLVKGNVSVAYALLQGAIHGIRGETGRGPYP